MTEGATYPAYSESGRYIGNYDALNVIHVFHGGARITGGKITVSDALASEMLGSTRYRAVENDDGTYGLWDEISFLSRFGIVFALNVHSKEDVRHLTQRGDSLGKAKKRGKPSMRLKSHGPRYLVYEADKDPQSLAARMQAYDERALARRAKLRQRMQREEGAVAGDTVAAPLDIDALVLNAGYPDEASARYIQRLFKRKGILGLVHKARSGPGGTLLGDFAALADNDLATRAEADSDALTAIIQAAVATYIDGSRGQSENGGLNGTLSDDAVLIDWAEANARADDPSLRSICHAILQGREHTFIFDGACFEMGCACTDTLHCLPYQVTLVRTSGTLENWGVAAIADENGFAVFPIGEQADTGIGMNLLAFVENECSAIQLEDGRSEYRGRRASLPRGSGEQGAQESRSHVIRIRPSSDARVSTTGGVGPTEPYMRRAHQRRQHFGPKGRYIKVVHINETTVFPKGTRPDSTLLPKEARVHHVRL